MDILEEEKTLLKGLAVSDSACIEKIYKDNFSAVHNFVLQNSGDGDDAADIFQESMIVLFEKSKNLDFELTCQIKTYIYSVSRRLWLKKLEKAKKFSKSDHSVENTVAVEEDLEDHETKEQNFNLMDSSLSKIGEPCKSLLEAYYIQKKPMQEIADRFGYTNADNAKTQKYKCLVRLKKLFFAQYKNGEK